jgi:hypothetical protein
MLRTSKSVILILGFFVLGLSFDCPCVFSQANQENAFSLQEVMNLFEALSGGPQIDDQTVGVNVEFPDNVNLCSGVLSAGSNSARYYGLKKKTWKGQYDEYDFSSPYHRDMVQIANRLGRLADTLIENRFIDKLAKRGLRPAIMFDIDNTLEFSADGDDDFVGDGPPIEPMVRFARKYCFQGNLECFFITARYCTKVSQASTIKWLKVHLGLDEGTILSHTFLTGNVDACEEKRNVRIAYKDSVRRALTEKEKIFWVFSVGDQLTDIFGSHSGIKVMLPNQFFKSHVVPHINTPDECSPLRVKMAEGACEDSLAMSILESTSAGFCGACQKRDGCFGKPE